MDLAYLPSPSAGVLHLGPIPLRAYAFCIILGVFVAVRLGDRRWVARGGERGVVADVTLWAVPFGLVGGRLYHVFTSPDAYFGERGEPIRALYVWEGGLGIWGAIALGAVGAWIGCRHHRVPLPAFADAVAPGIVLAQAIGRWGNWFNQELYGRPTTLPWGLEIDRAHRPAGMLDIETYHPTFLYESLWDIGVAALVLWAGRRFPLRHGRTFALYVAAYTVGRFWTEYLRVDEAHTFLGLRLNNWTSVLVFLGAVGCLVVSARRHRGTLRGRPGCAGTDGHNAAVDLRPELLPPPVSRQRLNELCAEVERIAELLVARPEVAGEAIQAFNAMTGHDYVALDFSEYDGNRSLEEFAREAARPARPVVADITRAELVEIVRRLLTAAAEGDYYLRLLEANLPHPRVSDLIFHPSGILQDPCPERIVDKALKYRPIVL